MTGRVWADSETGNVSVKSRPTSVEKESRTLLLSTGTAVLIG